MIWSEHKASLHIHYLKSICVFINVKKNNILIAFIKALHSYDLWCERNDAVIHLLSFVHIFGILLFMFSFALYSFKSCSFLFVYSIFPLFRSINQQALLFAKWLLSRDLFVTLFAHVKSSYIVCFDIHIILSLWH